MEQFAAKTEAAGAATQRTGSLMAAGLKAGALAVGVALAYSVHEAMQFEEQMRNVNSISKLSEGAFQNLSDRVIELSTRVPESATSLASGLYDIASSGFQGADGLKVLEAASMAATAGMTDTATSAKGITAVLNAYGLSAREAGYVSDTLFQTVNLGVVTFEELSAQIGDVVGIGAAAGINIGELGAAIAAMTLAGISGAESTTSLNRVIQTLIDPSDELAGLFNQMGYESGYAALQQEGLHGIMEKIRVATGGNVEALLKLFPEIRAARGAFALMANEGQNYAKTFDQIADRTRVAGATQDAFNEQMKSFSNQMRLAWNQIQAGAIDLGRALIPVLNDVLDFILELGSAISDFVGSVLDEMGPAFDSIGQIIEDVISIAGGVVEALAPIAKIIAGIGVAVAASGLEALADALAEVTEAVADSPAAIKILAVALAALAVNSQLAAGSFLALRAAAVANFFVGMANAARMLVVQLAAVVALNSPLVGSFRTLQGVATTLGQGLRAALTSPLVGIGLLIGGIVAIQSAFQRADSEAQQFVSSLRDTSGFDPKVPETYAAHLGLLQDELRRTNAAYDEQRGSVEGWAFSVVDMFVDVGDGMLDNAAKSAALRAEIDKVTATLGKFQSGFSQVWRAVHPEVGATFELLDQFDPRFQKLMRIAHQAGIDVSKPITQWRKDLTDAAIAAENLEPAQAAAHKAFSTVGDAASTAADKLKAYKEAMDAIIGVTLSAFSAETKWGEALEQAAASVAKAGSNMDIHTEAGRANREALSGAAESALKHAQAVADETGSIDQANGVLQGHVSELNNVMRQAGLSEEEITAMNQALGLTPENLAILLALNGAEEANRQLDALNAKARDLSQAKYIDIAVSRYTQDADTSLKGMQVVVEDITGERKTITVDANTVDADQDLQGFQVLVQDATGTHVMTIAADTADADLRLSGFQERIVDITGKEHIITVKVPGVADYRSDLEGTQILIADLEGKTHEITVETVGLEEDIIPTLEGIQVRVLDLEGKPHIITLDANGQPAHDKATEVDQALQALALKQFLTTIDANKDPATAKASELDAFLQSVVDKPRIPVIDANKDPATLKGQELDAFLASFGPYIPTIDADKGPADAKGAEVDAFLAGLGPYVPSITPEASDPNGVETFLNNLARDRVAAIEAQVRAVLVPAEGMIVGPGGGQTYAMGGINRYAAGGRESHQAGIYGAMWPGRFFAEPETGGEAYIPMGLSKRPRSTGILRAVAAQFGYGLVPTNFFQGLKEIIGGALSGPQAVQHAYNANVRTVLEFSGAVYGEASLKQAVETMLERHDRELETALVRARSNY